MSRKRIFKTLKVEHVYRQRFTDKENAAVSVFEWIETWYNRHRRHLALNNLTIEEFSKSAQTQNAA
jgi:transposase InsO family protein